MDYDENDAEYFFGSQLHTIPESSSFHDHDHSHHHRHRYRHADLDRQRHKKWQLLKFMSLFILQYAAVSFLFQYQWNLRHPPSLPPEYYQLDDDDSMRDSFIQTSKPRPEDDTRGPDGDERKDDIFYVAPITEKANVSEPSPPVNSTASTESKTAEKETESNQTLGTPRETPIPSDHENKEQERLRAVRGPSSKKHHQKLVPPPTVPLNLIPKSELNFYDYFSDSWLIPRDNFWQLNTSAMEHVEQACFQAIRRPGYYVHPTSKMFVDWTDFMVEHMSKWWGVFRIAKDPDPSMFEHVITILDNYLMKQASAYNEGLEHESSDLLPPLHRTLAMVAFREYQTTLNPERGPLLSSHALAATLASLVPMGFGRIVLVGYDPDDRTRVYEAFEILEASFKGAVLKHPKHSDKFLLNIGLTEFAYAKIPHEDWVKTGAYEVNVPRGAIRGVQMAILGSHSEEQSQEWLGSTYEPSYWKYFYLTEPDTILHTKPELLASIREGLDRGLSFFPHRLQPIPHEHDLPPEKFTERNDESWKIPLFEVDPDEVEESNAPGSDPQSNTPKHFSDRYAGMYLPGNLAPFSNITILDSTKQKEYHCCDGGKGWPGRSSEFGDTGHMPCKGKSWWACGLVGVGRYRSNERFLELHKRLIPYPLFVLQQGTGVVTGPTNAGRRCFPSKSPCPQQELHVLPASSNTNAGSKTKT